MKITSLSLLVSSICALSADPLSIDKETAATREAPLQPPALLDTTYFEINEEVANTIETPTQPPARLNADSFEARSSLTPSYKNNLFLEADFLYWYVKQEGNQYAVTGTPLTVPGTTDPVTLTTAGKTPAGKVCNLDFSARPGYKVGGGFNLEHGMWDLFVQYAFIRGHANGMCRSKNINAGILPIFSYTPHNSILSEATFSGGSEGFVSKASSDWSLSFNNINLELGRTLYPTNSLSLHPFFGVQGSWQKQDFDIKYVVSSIDNTLEVLGNNRVDFDQRFWGVGLRVGVDGFWTCVRHLDLFANLAAAALWGQFNCLARSYDTNHLEGYKDVLINNQTNNLHTLSPMIDLTAGLRSTWRFYSRYLLQISAGWENQVWFFQNQHSSSIADTSLILEGLTLQFRFDF